MNQKHNVSSVLVSSDCSKLDCYWAKRGFLSLNRLKVSKRSVHEALKHCGKCIHWIQSRINQTKCEHTIQSSILYIKLCLLRDRPAAAAQGQNSLNKEDKNQPKCLQKKFDKMWPQRTKMISEPREIIANTYSQFRHTNISKITEKKSDFLMNPSLRPTGDASWRPN